MGSGVGLGIVFSVVLFKSTVFIIMHHYSTAEAGKHSQFNAGIYN
jgi:hypothetical protein